MEKEGEIWKGREKLAEFLFDGDKNKAQQLLILIESFTNPVLPPEFKRKMIIPEEECTWCTNRGECFFYAPDSILMCKGKCEKFEGREENEN